MSYDSIRLAIEERKGISGYYNGQFRMMCPHVLGLKNGVRHALFYQFGGQSNSRPIQPDGSPENWRCIDISMLTDVEIIAIDKWHTASDHSRRQTCVDIVEVEVQY
jgi:hypothetical protein